MGERLHSALGYRFPEEFERQSAENSADSPGATVEFVVDSGNNENEKRIATELSRGRGLKRRPLPQTPSPARRYKPRLTTNCQVCPIFCLTTGVHPITWVQLGSKISARWASAEFQKSKGSRFNGTLAEACGSRNHSDSSNRQCLCGVADSRTSPIIAEYYCARGGGARIRKTLVSWPDHDEPE